MNMNLEEKLTKVEIKLSETEREYKIRQDEIKELEKKKADLAVNLMIQKNEKNKNEMDQVSKRLTKIRADIEFLPNIIESLKRKIEELNITISKEKGVARGLEQAKKIEKIKAMSQKFYKDLQNIKKLNDELGEEWHRLYEAGVDIGGGGVCTGSKDGLRTLLEVTAAEMNGQGRKPILFGSIPNFKI
ncbi:hypothetical protein ES695_13160 [Candidatus Atribacteria bacterium 1244-E10-H5-B2]|nr:MAG: hypothetical protein ES695_13160 [Candidatus Atribacteria bacterium 1244-E10-H5-B2]